MESYFETLKLKEEDDFVVMLVGNKIDLIDEREVSRKQIRKKSFFSPLFPSYISLLPSLTLFHKVSREEAERYAEERGFSYMELRYLEVYFYIFIYLYGYILFALILELRFTCFFFFVMKETWGTSTIYQ